MRQNACTLLDKLLPVLADPQAHIHIFPIDGVCLSQDVPAQFLQIRRRVSYDKILGTFFDSGQCPEQVDCGGASGSQTILCSSQHGKSLLQVGCCVQLLQSQNLPVGCRHTDGWGAANSERFYRFAKLLDFTAL
jgi:hypothetical protein